MAIAVSALVLLAHPLAAALTDAAVVLRPGWPWLLIGIFAFHGVAEELVWRGFAFRRLRAGRSFGRAVAWTMPLLAATHIPVVVSSGPAAAVTTFSLTLAGVSLVVPLLALAVPRRILVDRPPVGVPSPELP